MVDYSPQTKESTVLATSLVVKALSGRIFGFTVYNDAAYAQFIQIHNANSLPADTAVPKIPFRVPAKAHVTVDFGEMGLPMSTGIVLSNSSTIATKTIGSADCWFAVIYE